MSSNCRTGIGFVRNLKACVESGCENAELKLGMAQAQGIEVNRRQWERIPVPVPVFVRGLDENGGAFQEFTTALNISAGGVAFMLRRRPANNHVPLLVEIPAAPGPRSKDVVRRIQGVLTRIEVVLGWYLCGLRFEKPLLPESHARPKE